MGHAITVAKKTKGSFIVITWKVKKKERKKQKRYEETANLVPYMIIDEHEIKV